MQSSERLVRYTAEELREMVRRGEDETDYAALDAMTEEELEASIDDEEEGTFDSGRAIAGPHRSRSQSVGIDDDVHAWFKGEGDDYASLINTILRRWMVAHPRQAEAELVGLSPQASTRNGDAA